MKKRKDYPEDQQDYIWPLDRAVAATDPHTTTTDDRDEMKPNRFRFRAWHIRDKVMRSVWSLGLKGWDGEDSEINYVEIELHGTVQCSEHEVALMQSTGLLDKNGVEIFEGDVETLGGIVAWGGDEGEGLGQAAGWYLQWRNWESFHALESRCNENGNNWEIIGNIHENPELEKETP